VELKTIMKKILFIVRLFLFMRLLLSIEYIE